MTRKQLRMFWSRVGDVAAQVPLTINGEPTMAHRDDWKLVFTAGLMNERRIADGLDGQKVALGLRLRDIFKGLDEREATRLANDLILVVETFGANHGVEWSIDMDGNDHDEEKAA